MVYRVSRASATIHTVLDLQKQSKVLADGGRRTVKAVIGDFRIAGRPEDLVYSRQTSAPNVPHG